MLRDRRIAGLPAGVGTGMPLVAMPVQTLSRHGGLNTTFALPGLGGLVYAPVACSFLQSGARPRGGAAGRHAVVLPGVLTLLLLPIAARAVLGRTPERNPVCASA